MTDTVDTGRRRALVLSALAAPALTMARLPQAKAADHIHWDADANIVCVGGGAAGLSAAVTAVDLGDSVIVLEKAPILGGTTRRSGGVAWIPNNFTLRARGIDDREEDCLRYMIRYAYPERYRADAPRFGIEADEYALLEALYRNGSVALDRFEAIGATKFVRFELPGLGEPSADYAARLPENKVPHGRAVVPDPAKNMGRGSGLIDRMAAWLEQRGASLRTEHRAVRLLQADGRVIGLEAEHAGKVLRIRARKGVIFGSGGYAHNDALVRQHQTMLYGACAASTATGDFIPMAQAVGARMGHLGAAWRSQVVLEDALANRVLGRGVFIPPGDAMILVDKRGRRVVNEKRNYNDRTRVHFAWDPVADDYPNRLLFMVFDQRAIDVFGGMHPLPQDVREAPYIVSGADPAALAAKLQQRLDSLADKVGQVTLTDDFATALTATIERYNGFASAGHDADFRRGEDPGETGWLAYFSRPRDGKEAEAAKMKNTMHLFGSPPYHAIILAPGALDTSGGPQVDANAQVIGADGKPIPGLYGAGNCIAAPSRFAYFGAGGTIGPAMTFGYIAARAAHAAAKSDTAEAGAA